MNIFGRNLDSVEGETWQRHRRLTVPSFNEQVSSSVWEEATKQASQMLREWAKCGEQGTRSFAHDAATLALHVLTYAGLGIRYDFHDDEKRKPSAPHRLSYRDALDVVLRNFTMLVILPRKLLSNSFAPRVFRRVAEACEEFELYMKELVKKEKVGNSQRSENDADNLLRALVRASEAAAYEGGSEKCSPGRAGLADDELYGNLFVYNMGQYLPRMDGGNSQMI